VPGGVIGRGIGGLRLGQTRRAARADAGAPTTESARSASWCLDGGGSLLAVFDETGDASRVRLLLTDSAPFDADKIAVGTTARASRKRLRGEKRAGTARGAKLLVAPWRGRLLFVGLKTSRVAYIGVAKKGTPVTKVLRAASG
jgi:hypothetical protein